MSNDSELINGAMPDAIKEPVPDPEDAGNKQELIDNLCQAFLESEAVWWTPEYDGGASGVVFYLTAIRMIATKPFNDDEVQRKVMTFLERRVDEASDRLMADVNDRIKEALKKF